MHNPLAATGRERWGACTPTLPTAPNFHSALCLTGFSLAQRLVCHLCHKHCRQQQISVVHMCWLATPVHRDLSGYWVCCFIPEQQKASAFALPISLQICDKRPVTHLGMTKILRLCMKLCTKPQTSQNCHWLCHSHLTALPQLAQDFTVMKLLITWSHGKFPIRAESPIQCLKWLVLIQCGCLILFFSFWHSLSFYRMTFSACSRNTTSSLMGPCTAQHMSSPSQSMHFL